MKAKLGQFLTLPVGAPDLHMFRTVDMYTSASTASMREKVLRNFSKENCTLRVLIATTAFGMGVDFPDIRKIFHWAPPCLLEDYVQQTGRAGRDGEQSQAVLMYGNLHRETSAAMKEYAENKSVYRRNALYKNFLFAQNDDVPSTPGRPCCDFCDQ